MDKRGTSGHRPGNKKDNDIEQMFAPNKKCGKIVYEAERRRGRTQKCEDSITTERRGWYDYPKEGKDDMLSGALKKNVIEVGETKEEFAKRKRDKRKKTLHEGKLQGQLVEKTRNIAHKFSVDKKWVFDKKETEGMLFAAQEQALRTNSIKAKIDKQPVSPKCKLYGTKEETVMHLVSVTAPSWHRNSTKEDMTMLPEEYLENCVRSMNWKVQKNGMSIHPLMPWRMIK